MCWRGRGRAGRRGDERGGARLRQTCRAPRRAGEADDELATIAAELDAELAAEPAVRRGLADRERALRGLEERAGAGVLVDDPDLAAARPRVERELLVGLVPRAADLDDDVRRTLEVAAAIHLGPRCGRENQVRDPL